MCFIRLFLNCQQAQNTQPRRVYWAFVENKWCGGKKTKQKKKMLVIITSFPVIPGIPWLWWYGMPIHSFVCKVCVCLCKCMLAHTAGGHAHNTQTHRHTKAFPCKLKREGVTEEHGRPWEKKAATEAGVLVWNPATKEPRIKHTMGTGCWLREGGSVCVIVCDCEWESERHTNDPTLAPVM